jgi:hypothetical protein
MCDFFILSDVIYLHIVINDSTGPSDISCSLALVTSEHPYFHVSSDEILYTRFDIVLEKIFDPCDTQKLVISLDVFYLIMVNLLAVQMSEAEHQGSETC